MTTAVVDHRLLKALGTTTSATRTLAAHLGLSHLELDRMRGNGNHRLTARERDALKPSPGVFYGYHREGFLRTPDPSWRPVAWVTATVLTSRLPEHVARLVMDARRPLGEVLIAAGAVRESPQARHERREDYSGHPIFLVSGAVFRLDGKPVAVVSEQVYDWVAR